MKKAAAVSGRRLVKIDCDAWAAKNNAAAFRVSRQRKDLKSAGESAVVAASQPVRERSDQVVVLCV